MSKELERKSKYLAKLLRHKPEDLVLDKFGWVITNTVCIKLNISQVDLELIVSTNDKKRFEFDTSKTKIRASQGHSLNHLEVWKDWENIFLWVIYITEQPIKVLIPFYGQVLNQLAELTFI